MKHMVYSLSFRMKEWFVLSCLLWMMSPDLTTSPSSPKVSLIEPWVTEKLQVYEIAGDCQFCCVFVGGQQSAGTVGRLDADSISFQLDMDFM